MARFACMDCPDRVVGCHATCEKYLKEREEHERLKVLDKPRHDMLEYAASGISKSKSKVAKRKQRMTAYGGKNYFR